MPMNPTQYLTFEGALKGHVEEVIERLGPNVHLTLDLLKASINQPTMTQEAFNAKLATIDDELVKASLAAIRELWFEGNDMNLQSMGDPLVKGEIQEAVRKFLSTYIDELSEKLHYQKVLQESVSNVGKVVDDHLQKRTELQEKRIMSRVENQELWLDVLVERKLQPIKNTLAEHTVTLDRHTIHIEQIVVRVKENTVAIQKFH